MKKLEIKSLPSLIVYNGARDRILKMDGMRFGSREIVKFVEFAKMNKKKFKMMRE
jgi:hypothetical protein